MTSLFDCLEKYHLSVDKITIKDNYIILYENNKKYLLIEKKESQNELLQFLKKINYSYYPSKINDDSDSYELYWYSDDNTTSQEKGEILIDALLALHKKTMQEEMMDEKDVEELYEKIKKELAETESYYEEIQSNAEYSSFPRIDYYYFLNNITLFYQSLWNAKSFLERWYHLETHKRMKSLVMHNACYDNLIVSDTSYFINFQNCYRDDRIQDLVFLYKTELLNQSMNSLIEKYNKDCPLTESEDLLFKCLISIPESIVFSSNHYDNTVAIKYALDKIDKTFFFLSEKDKENQKTNEEELKE